MFPLNPDIARLLVGYRVDDDQTRAENDIRIAEAQPVHRSAVLTFLGELSPQTVYLRFVTRAAPGDVVDLDLLLSNDACHRAVLALRGDEVVGHAHAVATPHGRTVELGVVVADEWQSLGIGPRLVRALLRTGLVAAADDLDLLVLAWNRRARRMILSLWPDAVPERDGELIHYRVHTASAPGSQVPVPAATLAPCWA